LPLEAVLAAILPLIGITGDIAFDGAEAVVGPVIMATMLLPYLVAPPLVRQIRAEGEGARGCLLRWLSRQSTASASLFSGSNLRRPAIAADPKHLGAKVGFFAVLHTWAQNLLHHPHLHCLVPGGGLSADGSRWISCRDGFFLSVRVLSRLFRRLPLKPR